MNKFLKFFWSSSDQMPIKALLSTASPLLCVPTSPFLRCDVKYVITPLISFLLILESNFLNISSFLTWFFIQKENVQREFLNFEISPRWSCALFLEHLSKSHIDAWHHTLKNFHMISVIKQDELFEAMSKEHWRDLKMEKNLNGGFLFWWS